MKTNNLVKFFRDPNFEGIELCDVTRSNHSFPEHFHNDVYAFSFMEKGGSYWTQKEKNDSLVKPGDLAMINPGILHSGYPFKENSSTYKMMYIKNDLIQNTFKDIVKNEDIDLEFEKVVLNNSISSKNFKTLYSSILSSSDQLEKETLLFNFIGDLTKQNATIKPAIDSNSAPDIIKIATEFLSEDLDKKLSLEEISNMVNLSRYHFLRVFKKSIGTSPHIYRMQKRIEKAKVSILKGKPLVEVAFETGFTDQSHLSNKFREYTGATPKQYFTIL